MSSSTEESLLDRLSQLIQDDLICLLDSQFGEVEYIDEVRTMACQIVVDRVQEVRELSRRLDAHDDAMLQKLSEIESQIKKEKSDETP